MASFVQTSLPAQITTPLGPNALLVRSYSGEEGISELFRYDLELYSANPSLDATQIVGQAVTLQIPLSNGSFQYVNGIVGRFIQAGMDNRFVTYRAELHPWLWMLTVSHTTSRTTPPSTPWCWWTAPVRGARALA